MKLKRHISILICVCLLFLLQSTCFAAGGSRTVDTNYNTREVTIAGNTGIDEVRRLFIVILEKGKDLDDLTDANIKAQTIMVYSIQTEADGDYSFTALLPERFNNSDAAGEYRVRVMVEGESPDATENSDTFYWATTLQREEAVRAINGMTTANAESVLSGHATTLGIRLSAEYTNGKSFVHAAMLHLNAERKVAEGEFTIEDIPEIAEIYYRALWIGTLASKADLTDAALVSESEQLLTPLNATDYNANKTEVWKAFTKVRTGETMVTIADMQKVFDKALALVMVNTSNRSQLLEVLPRYNTAVLNLDLGTKYQTYNLEITKELEYKDFASIAAIRTAYSAALNNVGVEDDDDDDDDYRGGGGGGGGISMIQPSTNPDASTGNKPDSNKKTFTDIDEATWATDYINRLAEANILSGYSDGSIRPNNFITREEFCKLLTEAFNLPGQTVDGGFADVSAEAWYYDCISRAVAAGIINGQGDGNFGVGKKITREDMAVMAYRVSQYCKKSLAGSAQTDFADAGNISTYATESVAKLAQSCIISGRGDGNFDPKGNATRAECAKIICSLLDAN